jgi:hypothetical protein
MFSEQNHVLSGVKMLKAHGHQGGDIKHAPSHQYVQSKLTYHAIMYSTSDDVIKCAHSARKDMSESLQASLLP